MKVFSILQGSKQSKSYQGDQVDVKGRKRPQHPDENQLMFLGWQTPAGSEIYKSQVIGDIHK